jgi:hypothetical protein
MAKKKKEDSFEELMKGIDWNRYLPGLISIMQPIVIFGSWLAFSKFDSRADAVSKLIALAEPIPTIDLNVPKPVVLASLYHSTDEALKILSDVIAFLKDVDIPSADDIIQEIKDEIKDPIVEVVEDVLEPTSPEFQTSLANCVISAKKNLGAAYWILGPAYILQCMLQKGFKVSLNYIKEKLF